MRVDSHFDDSFRKLGTTCDIMGRVNKKNP